jgi:hypothetical protein
LTPQSAIVGVHESGGGGNGLCYRVGHLRNPAGYDYTIQWDSPTWGIYYDEGINPHIAINNLNEVVQVHQVPSEQLLHYRRGVINGGTILFEASRRYDNYAEQPAVALLDSGLVLEVHSLGGLIYRTGRLSLSNAEEIEWAEPVKLDDEADISYPAVAATRTYAVETHLVNGLGEGYQLHFSVANTCQSS